MTRQDYLVWRRHWCSLSVDYPCVNTGNGGISISAVSRVRWRGTRELIREKRDCKFILKDKIILQNHHASLEDRTAWLGGSRC